MSCGSSKKFRVGNQTNNRHLVKQTVNAHIYYVSDHTKNSFLIILKFFVIFFS